MIGQTLIGAASGMRQIRICPKRKMRTAKSLLISIHRGAVHTDGWKLSAKRRYHSTLNGSRNRAITEKSVPTARPLFTKICRILPGMKTKRNMLNMRRMMNNGSCCKAAC